MPYPYDENDDEVLQTRMRVLGDIGSRAEAERAKQLKAKHTKPSGDITKAPEKMDESPVGVEVKIGSPTIKRPPPADIVNPDGSTNLTKIREWHNDRDDENSWILNQTPSDSIPFEKKVSGEMAASPVDYEIVGDRLLVKYKDGTMSEEPMDKLTTVEYLMAENSGDGEDEIALLESAGSGASR